MISRGRPACPLDRLFSESSCLDFGCVVPIQDGAFIIVPDKEARAIARETPMPSS